MKTTLPYQFFVFFTAMIITITSCSKKNDTSPNTTPEPLAVTSLSVTNGGFNTTVLITGTGFSAEKTFDRVYFNGNSAVIISATTTELVAQVPENAGTGNVSVTVSGGTAVKGPVFTYTLTGVVITYSGTLTPGNNDGLTLAATFNNPRGLTIDGANNLYVADYGNNLIRKISATGTVSTVVANAPSPSGIAIDGAGNIFFTSLSTNNIYKVTGGVLSVFAGSGTRGFADGTGAAASFAGPQGMSIDAAGNLYVTDTENFKIRKITPAGVVTTIAGAGQVNIPDAPLNGSTAVATFTYPLGIAVDAAGSLYVSDTYAYMIRKIAGTTVSTLAGKNVLGGANGNGANATFNAPASLALDASGNILVADGDNNEIRKVTPTGDVTTIAVNGTAGSANLAGGAATFNYPQGLAVDAAGNIYVADALNNMIRRITFK